MRIVKEHEERKNEIIDTAAALFAAKGYEECSVNDILTAIGIAKGTFYHYFKSKEEVLDAVIEKTTHQIVAQVRQVAAKQELTPEEKLLQIFLTMRVEAPESEAILEEIHKTENALLHQKSLNASLNGVVPILTKVVEEGNEKGVFHCIYPEQDMQIFLAAALTLLDDGIFQVEPRKMQRIFEAMMAMLEKILGVEENYIQEMVTEYWKF